MIKRTSIEQLNNKIRETSLIVQDYLDTAARFQSLARETQYIPDRNNFTQQDRTYQMLAIIEMKKRDMLWTSLKNRQIKMLKKQREYLSRISSSK